MASLVGPILVAAASHGIPSARLIESAGLSHVPRSDPLDRLSLAGAQRLLAAAVESTHDPCFGLLAGNFVRATTLHALGYALLASSSLREFAGRWNRYVRLVTQHCSTVLTERNGSATLEFAAAAEAVPQLDDMLTVFLVRFLAELSDSAIRPSVVSLTRRNPPDGGSQHATAFGCPVEFHARRWSIRFRAAALDLPLPGACRELAEHNEKILVSYISKLDRNDIEARVRALLLEELPAGSVTKDSIAKQLFMSPRTLQIKLSKCNTTFHDLVNETRRSLAYGYMDNSGMSVTEIAYLLGFSDTSNFSRAFRRWTGCSPTEHRSTNANRVADRA